jgi:hypothetical protein
MAYTGRALAEQGHQVTIAVMYSQRQGPHIIGKMEQLHWGDPNEKVYFSNKAEVSERLIQHYRESSAMESFFYSFFEWPKITCDAFLRDKKLYETVKAQNYDLVIIDGLIITRCNYIFVYNLGIPYISQTAGYPYDIGLISKYFGNPFTTTSQLLQPDQYVKSDVGKMTFMERLSNAMSMVALTCALRYQIYQQYERYKNYSTHHPLTKGLSELATDSKLWLIEQNPVLDYPRPIYGTIKLIGGMNWKPSKPLTDEYEKISNAAMNGFIVVSLGADLLFMPKDIGDKMAAAFKRMPKYKFIWANKGDLTKQTPENVMKVGWIPQNDLIGHKNCQLFITHCGNNGQFEAVGHGVPMLGVPIHRDQPGNAWRMIDKGFGLAVNLNTVTVDEIVEKTTEVLTNAKYKDNIMKAKAVFHDLPRRPTEEAVYWVEHVLKHGTDYIKSDAMEMPWYQVLGYDITAFLALVVILFVMVARFTCSLLIKKIKGNVKSKSDILRDTLY